MTFDPFSPSPSPVLARMIASGAMSEANVRALISQDLAGKERQMLMLAGLGRFGQELFMQALRSQHFERTTAALPDGTTGYYERAMRTDDCFAACLATCLQVPIEEVPDPRLDERLQAGEDGHEIGHSAWRRLAEWLDERRLRMLVHETPPWKHARWIGVIGFPGHFNDHCVVMSKHEVLFDPVDKTRHSRPVRAYAAEDISRGFTFEPFDPSPQH